jgi:hypothetical protein
VKAIVLERNTLVGRKIARLWGCAGLETVCVQDPAALPAALSGARLLGADVFDGEVVLAALRANPTLRAALWTAEPLDRALRFAAGEPRLSSVFGRAAHDETPREWELLLAARRIARRGDPAPFHAFLAWGHTGMKATVGDSTARDVAVEQVQKFVEKVGAPRRTAEMFGELAHELLMNALYDAPVDGAGRPRYAHDRKQHVRLAAEEAPTLRAASDGVRLVLQVVDPFGRLGREHVFGGVARGLRGELDTRRGGAGLGMAACVNSTTAMFFDVVHGHKTEVTGLLELDLNLREIKTRAKSLHYFDGEVGKAA